MLCIFSPKSDTDTTDMDTASIDSRFGIGISLIAGSCLKFGKASVQYTGSPSRVDLSEIEIVLSLGESTNFS